MPIKMQTRTKQPYLVNPINPWKRISVPKHTYAVWSDRKTKRFAKPSLSALAKLPTFAKKHHITLNKAAFLNRMNKGRVAAGLEPIKAKGSKKIFKSKAKKSGKMSPAAKKAFLARMAKGRKKAAHKPAKRKGYSIAPKLMSKTAFKKFNKKSPFEAMMAKQMHHAAGFQYKNPYKRSHSMAKHRRRKSFKFSNPFNVKGIVGDVVDKDMLIDTGIAGLGLMATNVAVGFAANKVAFLSTPTGKTLGKLVMAVVFKRAGKMLGKASIGKALAMGATLSAIQDIYEIVLPKLGYAGGVRLLESGYMPDVSAGYMPDTPALSSGYMPDTPEGVGEGSYGFSD